MGMQKIIEKYECIFLSVLTCILALAVTHYKWQGCLNGTLIGQIGAFMAWLWSERLNPKACSNVILEIFIVTIATGCIRY